MQKQTQAWLRRHGYDCPSVYTTRGSRGAIAAALTLDVVVDDRLLRGAWTSLTSRLRAPSSCGVNPTNVSRRGRGAPVLPSYASVGACLDLLEHPESPARVRPDEASQAPPQAEVAGEGV